MNKVHNWYHNEQILMYNLHTIIRIILQIYNFVFSLSLYFSIWGYLNILSFLSWPNIKEKRDCNECERCIERLFYLPIFYAAWCGWLFLKPYIDAKIVVVRMLCTCNNWWCILSILFFCIRKIPISFFICNSFLYEVELKILKKTMNIFSLNWKKCNMNW